MTEAKVGFLYNIASKICTSGSNSTQTLLKSYYLMRCKEITNGYGLPNKHFSPKARCPQCCLDWKIGTEVRVKPTKLSQRQRQRIKRLKRSNTKKRLFETKKALLHSNEMEKVCSFCSHRIATRLKKPEKQNLKAITTKKVNEDPNAESCKENAKKSKVNRTKLKTDPKINMKKTPEVNIYANAFDVFAINNKNNTVASAVKETPKVIQNCKKKKDKLAGLCQKAVMASAKWKQEKGKQNKLNLFLKPSTGNNNMI